VLIAVPPDSTNCEPPDAINTPVTEPPDSTNCDPAADVLAAAAGGKDLLHAAVANDGADIQGEIEATHARLRKMIEVQRRTIRN
jgi:hypothetical protein